MDRYYRQYNRLIVLRDLRKSTNKKLIICCGKMYHRHRGCDTMDIRVAMNPSIVGSVTCPEHMKFIPSQKYEQVIFECAPCDLFRGVVFKQVFRILKPGGKMIIAARAVFFKKAPNHRYWEVIGPLNWGGTNSDRENYFANADIGPLRWTTGSDRGNGIRSPLSIEETQVQAAQFFKSFGFEKLQYFPDKQPTSESSQYGGILKLRRPQ